MKNNSRTKNSIVNISVNMLYQMLNVIVNFIIRTVFIKMLSAEYLGVNGLFTNILSVLSLAELGIGNAIIYTMYKPLQENDKERLSALTTYYKKLYNRIGVFILIVGILLIPFLKTILNLQDDIGNVYLYYLLFLLNTVSSYFIVYKTSIVTADQKEYVLKKINIIFVIIKFILQIVMLKVFKSYLGYLIIQIAISILLNWVMSKKAEKMYPFIKEKREIEDEEKKNIWENIKSLFMYQFGGVVLNNTDNIIISIMVGTIFVGIYSNYSMLITTVSTFTALVFTSMISSIGNYNIKSTEKSKKFLFDILEMLFFWMYGFASVSFVILTQDFITLWIGKEYLLDNITLYIIVFNFYLTGVLYPIFCFRNTTSLFKKTKHIMLVASIINIVLSIVLGFKWGLAGILVATGIARMCTNIWYEPYILHRDYFKEKVNIYYIKKVLEIIILVVIIWIIQMICNLVSFDNIYINFVFKMLLCVLVPNIIMFIKYFRTEEFKYILNIVKGKLKH